MHQLMNISNNKMMSSKEIAELTGKRHADVLRDIRKMFDDLDNANLRHEQYQEVKDNRGYTSEFLLDHDLTMLLLTGYDVKARLKVIQRWKELESKAVQPQFQVPTTLSGALMLAAQQAEQIEQQQAVIQQQAPKAEFHDRFIDAAGLTSITVTAKELGIGRNEFVDRCIASRVIYRDARGTLMPYERCVLAGYCAMKAEEHNGKQRPQTFFTAKGLAWIGKRIIKTEQEQAITVVRSDAPHLAAIAALGIQKPVINGMRVN